MKSSRSPVLAALVLVPVLMFALVQVSAGQSGTAVSPFVSYVPSAVENPLVGMSLTFGGTTGLAFRGGADLSIENPRRPDSAGTISGYRPWSADADAMLFLGGLGGGATVFDRTLSPYLFTGLGLYGGDSAGVNVTHNGWSYGVGARLPLGLNADIFGEARWRMPEYVLPTSKGAPDSKSEFRFGLSFLVGGGEPQRPRRRRYADEEDDRPVVATAPAPQPAPPQVVIVQQPAPQPAPTVVVVPQPEPEPRTTVNVNFPWSIIWGSTSSRSRRHDHDIVVIQRPVVTHPVWVPTIPVITTRQKDPAPTLSCTRSSDRRGSKPDAMVCVPVPQ